MSNLNKTMLIGRVGRDPELRYSTNGAAVVNISLATSRSWKDKSNNEKIEEVEWHKLVAYDKLAEIVGQYIKKGSLAYFEGRLKTRKWQDKDGRDVYTTEVVFDQMQMLGGRDSEGGAEPLQQRRAPAPAPPAPNAYAAAKAGRPPPKTTGTNFDDMDGGIPF